jgi:hypothetical protein
MVRLILLHWNTLIRPEHDMESSGLSSSSHVERTINDGD